MNGLTIGKLAKQAGLGIETVRFYERQGLIEPPPRTDSNYRIYPEEEVSRLKFIKRAKDLGFTLKEIKELFVLQHDPHATKADIKKRTVEKIEDIKKKVQDLTRIQEVLEHLAGTCEGHGPISECPILDALTGKEHGHHHH
ncbi:MAG: MerR family transcriptional regulator [Thermodesulfobacteriota bacterium]